MTGTDDHGSDPASQRVNQSTSQREQEFLRRRRIVLFGFGFFTLLFAGLALVFHRAVGGGFVWLFSESYAAVIALSIIMALWAAKAQRARTLNAMRPQVQAQAARSISPPGVAMLKMALVILALLALTLCLQPLR